MDLWVTRGLPKPPLPHVPGCDVVGHVDQVGEGVTTVAEGDRVVINPAVSPVEEIVALGNDSPMGAGFMIYGEHCWGGHGEYAVAPARNVVTAPASRTSEELAAYPLAYLTAYRMLRRGSPGGRRRPPRRRGGQRGGERRALPRSAHGSPSLRHQQERSQAREAITLGAEAAYDSAERSWPVEADVVVESVGPATWEQSIRALKAGGRLVVCGGTSGPKVELNLPRLFFKQIEIIGSTMGSYQEFAAVTDLVDHGLAIKVDQTFGLLDYPVALERLEHGAQFGKIVLRHG